MPLPSSPTLGKEVTGKTRTKIGWFGVMIAEVQIVDDGNILWKTATNEEWGRAKEMAEAVAGKARKALDQ